jgi:hypothetical protein
VLLLFAIGCATGGSSTGDDDDDTIDAPTGGTIDAPMSPMIDAAVPRPDAFVPPAIDAAVPPMPVDAAVGPFCSMDSECAAGECCFFFGMPPGFCTPGMSVPGLGCVPM